MPLLVGTRGAWSAARHTSYLVRRPTPRRALANTQDIKTTMVTKAEYAKIVAENDKLKTAIGSLETQLKDVV